MLDRGEYYRDSATDYEALSVQRNALSLDQDINSFRLHSETSLIQMLLNPMAFNSQVLSRPEYGFFHVNPAEGGSLCR